MLLISDDEVEYLPPLRKNNTLWVRRKSKGSRVATGNHSGSKKVKKEETISECFDRMEAGGSTTNSRSSTSTSPDMATPISVEIQNPMVENLIFQSPAFQPIPLQTPKLETPNIGTPTVENPILQYPAFQPIPLQTPKLETPNVGTPTVENPILQSPAFQPVQHQIPEPMTIVYQDNFG